MRRYETPLAIAQALARHAPRKTRRLLDPAVGNGALLAPFFRRSGEVFRAIALDTDPKPLSRVRLKFGSDPGKELRVVHADFLEWACGYIGMHGELFDCVVMNPPFEGRKNRWRSLVGLAGLFKLNSLPQVGPVEAGFILGAIALLKPGGRLLAVLPASVMTSPSAGWVRRVMAATGAIRHVHELPRFAFPEIESRIYLVIYEKSRRQGQVLLLNHDLVDPEQLVVGAKVVAGAERLDFAFHNATGKLRRLKELASLGWRPVGEIATVWRGTERTPGIGKSVVHSGNYISGFWRASVAQPSRQPAVLDRRILGGDILVRRVSRNCARSFGMGMGVRGALASDCVLVVRRRHQVSSVRLLFAIRCLMALDFGPGLLERGTGASYMAQGELRNLVIPYGLSTKYKKLFEIYAKAVRCHSFPVMQRIESQVRKNLVEAISAPD